jgi:AcrR family transcriptional regulator
MLYFMCLLRITVGTKERRERERDAVRTKILDAARALFVAQGYDGVSMRAIAEQIEYSPTLIYQYFEDKETLIKELCYVDFGALAERLKETLAIADPIARLKQCGREYVRFAIAYPNHYRLMFMTLLPVKGDKAEWEQRQGKPETDAYALLQLMVQRAAEEGALRDPHASVDLVAQTLWAGLHGVIALEIVMGCEADWVKWGHFETRTEAMLDALGGGLFAEKR